MTALLVAIGGSLGAVLRALVDGEIKLRTRRTWPVATLLINVVGSFVLGAVTSAHVGPNVSALVVTGVCGGFTTFSTASVETLTLLRSRRGGATLAYAVGSLLVCVAAVLLGASAGAAAG